MGCVRGGVREAVGIGTEVGKTVVDVRLVMGMLMLGDGVSIVISAILKDKCLLVCTMKFLISRLNGHCYPTVKCIVHYQNVKYAAKGIRRCRILVWYIKNIVKTTIFLGFV